jgi:hypothetical protein
MAIPRVEKKSAKLSPEALAEVEAAFEQYTQAVLESDLSLSSQSSYVDMSGNFLRWLTGDFEPGSRVRMPARSKLKSVSRD